LLYKHTFLVALRALLRCIIAYVDIATYGAYKFLLCHII